MQKTKLQQISALRHGVDRSAKYYIFGAVVCGDDRDKLDPNALYDEFEKLFNAAVGENKNEKTGAFMSVGSKVDFEKFEIGAEDFLLLETKCDLYKISPDEISDFEPLDPPEEETPPIEEPEVETATEPEIEAPETETTPEPEIEPAPEIESESEQVAETSETEIESAPKINQAAEAASTFGDEIGIAPESVVETETEFVDETETNVAEFVEFENETEQ